MLAYCTALSVRRAWLVYAGGTEPKVRRIRNTAIDIVKFPISLAASPVEILKQISGLAERAWLRETSQTALSA